LLKGCGEHGKIGAGKVGLVNIGVVISGEGVFSSGLCMVEKWAL